MEVVALIPARGGSKGVPRKNLAVVGGKPLIAWTVEAAQRAQELSRVVVSTDDDEIAAAAGVETLWRPAELARDATPMLDVVRHAIDQLRPEIVVLLQPTSPLRRPEHIDAAVRFLHESDADSVVSVVEVPHRYAPESLMDLVDGRVVPRGQARTRQEKASVYARNGPAVLALRASRLGDDLYGGDCRPFVMDERDSLDVDSEFDLELADLLLRR
jgi:CMP-N,N'-diacetyllegionaminic acid synthase